MKFTFKVSIIIPTLKDHPITLDSVNSCPVAFEIVLSKVYGIGYARNFGARQAKGDLLVFLDDDIVLSPDIWEYILNVKKGEFKMTWYDYDVYPCGRVMVIHAKDFWRVGGFDEQVKILGEDRIFYLTAVRRGLGFMRIPTEYIRHIEHERRSKQGILKVKTILESARNFAHYGFNYCGLKGLAVLKTR